MEALEALLHSPFHVRPLLWPHAELRPKLGQDPFHVAVVQDDNVGPLAGPPGPSSVGRPACRGPFRALKAGARTRTSVR